MFTLLILLLLHHKPRLPGIVAAVVAVVTGAAVVVGAKVAGTAAVAAARVDESLDLLKIHCVDVDVVGGCK